MYVSRAKWPSGNGKVYESIYLRESYREGEKVKKREIANLTHCRPKEVAAIELALKHKGDLTLLGSLKAVKVEEGLSVGAVWAVYAMAKRVGIERALGKDLAEKLALWQVIARVLDQGSRLSACACGTHADRSAVRLAQGHAACDVLGIRRGFDKNDLYENLAWLSEQQEKIEKSHFWMGVMSSRAICPRMWRINRWCMIVTRTWLQWNRPSGPARRRTWKFAHFLSGPNRVRAGMFLL